jgi:hypothetical protein
MRTQKQMSIDLGWLDSKNISSWFQTKKPIPIKEFEIYFLWVCDLLKQFFV